MKNHNNRQFSSENDDADNESYDIDSETSQESPKVSRNPFKLNPDILEFLLSPKKEEQAFHNPELTDEDDSNSLGKRQKRTAKTLKGLFKRRKFVSNASSGSEEVNESPSPLESQEGSFNNSEPKDDKDPTKDTPKPEQTSSSQSRDQEHANTSESQEDKPEDRTSSQAEADKEESPEPTTESPQEPTRPNKNSQQGNAAPVAPAMPGSTRASGTAPSVPQIEAFMPPVAVANSHPHQIPGAVERRGGIAGPVTAFLAANYLSRRRHKKNKKEIKNTNKQLKEVQSKQKSHNSRLNKVEKNLNEVTPRVDALKNTEKSQPKPSLNVVNSASIQQHETAQPHHDLAPKLQPREAEDSPVPIAEVLAASTVLHQMETKELSEKPKTIQEKDRIMMPASEASVESVSTKEASEIIKPAQKEKTVVESVEKFDDLPTTDINEKPNKAKKSSSLPKFGGPNPAGNSLTQFGAQKNRESSMPASFPISSTHTDIKAPQNYKKSIQNGVVFGVFVAVLGIISYLFVI